MMFPFLKDIFSLDLGDRYRETRFDSRFLTAALDETIMEQARGEGAKPCGGVMQVAC